MISIEFCKVNKDTGPLKTLDKFHIAICDFVNYTRKKAKKYCELINFIIKTLRMLNLIEYNT